MKKTLDFTDYKQCLLAGRKAFRKQLMLQNKLHEVHIVEVNKQKQQQASYPNQWCEHTGTWAQEFCFTYWSGFGKVDVD